MVSMSRLEVPCCVLLLIHRVHIMATEGEESAMLDRLDPHSMARGVARDPPLLPAPFLVFGGENSAVATGAENLMTMSPRCNDESSIFVVFVKPPHLPPFPITSRVNVTEDVTAEATIIVGMRDKTELVETELVARLLHTWETKEGVVLVRNHVICLGFVERL